ncbi:CLUMA_CG013248, isoform A [Clunio marinus]|uniref:CLUMA_CG013248, isoform A n=1 Tax=Clunio marinus TaxID=568069 RepID=A0A1J1II61_9DIPT|nr:CLUMA_CG013248, isoform A [Clunio marinus]
MSDIDDEISGIDARPPWFSFEFLLNDFMRLKGFVAKNNAYTNGKSGFQNTSSVSKTDPFMDLSLVEKPQANP